MKTDCTKIKYFCFQNFTKIVHFFLIYFHCFVEVFNWDEMIYYKSLNDVIFKKRKSEKQSKTSGNCTASQNTNSDKLNKNEL
jgi:hypothetical protein